jgi:hypothetical protein
MLIFYLALNIMSQRVIIAGSQNSINWNNNTP